MTRTAPAPPRHLAAITLLAILCATLVAVGRTRAPAVDLAIGAERLAESVFVSGIYQREQRPAGASYRWTSGSALIQLRGAFYVAPAYIATLRLRAEHPAGPQPLTFLANERPLATLRPEGRPRTYQLLLPAAAADHELRLNLKTNTFVAPGNPRPLGVELTAATLRPLPRPDLGAGALAGLGLLALWGAQLALGRPPRQALALAALAGLGLAALAALYRPAPLSFATLAALSLGAIGLGGLAAPLAARLGLAALSLIVGFSGVLWPAWLSDDAFISFRYAQNLAAGNGLVYNLGERVEGYTNFLWTILAALVIRLGGDVATWSHLAGVALGLGIVLGSYFLAERGHCSVVRSRLRRNLTTPMPPPPAATALLTALIVGTSQSLLLYTARGAGLETGLFTLLLLVAVWLYLVSTQNAECRMQHAGRLALLPADQRPRTAHTIALIACGATLALLSMTRPEGVLIAGLTGLHLLISEVGSQKSAGGAPGAAQGPSSGAAPHAARRAAIRRITSRLGLLTAAFMAVFLPYFLWRLSYYGDLLPNTFYAKTGGGLQQVLRGLGYAGGFALTLGGPLLLVILLPWLRGWRAALGSWRGYLLPVALIYSAYVVAVGGDHFRGERFFVPILPLIAILLADGLAQAWWVALAQGPMAVGREPRALGRGPWTEGREPGAESQGPRAATRAPWAGRAGAYAIRPYGIWHVALALLFLTGGLAALARTAPIDATMRGLDESVWIWREIGWWVADHGPPEASVAAQGAGAIAFYSQRTTIDLLGLTDKHIGRLEVSDMGAGVAGHEKRDPAYVLNVRRPTYIPQIWEGYFGGAPGLRAQYDLVPIVTRSGRELGMWVRR